LEINVSKKLKTNEDLVVDLMNFSPRGALCQAFIVQAIQEYCESVIKAGAEACDSGMINGQAWVDIAQDTKQRIEEFYK
jgi:hypothetical protein